MTTITASQFQDQPAAGLLLVDVQNDFLLAGGLATDYGVLNTVRDARRLDSAVLVRPGCIRKVEIAPGDGARAIAAMRTAGVVILGE
jgi:nicotinamidase-related amidase